jgi:hypothetical protein
LPSIKSLSSVPHPTLTIVVAMVMETNRIHATMNNSSWNVTSCWGYVKKRWHMKY